MARVARSDTTKLDGSKRTPEGYIDTFGNLTRTGVFEYRRADGTTQRELRLPEHVFTQDAISSFHAQPLTVLHPAGGVTAENFKRVGVGVVLDPHKSEDGIHLRARIRVMDADAVRAVENGLRELSNGYTTELVPIDGGRLTCDGVEYVADYLQTEIQGNHTALVPVGRAGPTARLDSAGNQGEQGMTKEEKEAFDKALAEAAAEKVRADAAEAKLAVFENAEKARRDAELAKAKEQLIAKIALITKKDAAELSKLDNASLVRTALATMQPSLKTDSWSEDALRGAFEVACSMAETRVDSASAMASAVSRVKVAQVAVKEDGDDSEGAYRKMNAAFFARK